MNFVEANRLCRTRQPPGKDIARLVKWANAGPSADKVAPLLILFTQYWAFQQYDVPQQELFQAIARCAERGDEDLWECIEGDYDSGRVDAAVTVSLYMPDVARRLPRLFEYVRAGICAHMKDQLLRSAEYHGVPVPADLAVVTRPVTAPGTFEERRPFWPSERDQLTLEEELGRNILSDEDAHRLCRKFQPTKKEIRKVLDWAIARPDADKLRWLFLLCTDYQLGKDYVRWNEVADMLAAIDMTAVWEVLQGDWEYSRLLAAGMMVCRMSDRSALVRLMNLCAESDVVLSCLGSSVRHDAQRLGLPETESFRLKQNYREAWRQGRVPQQPSSGEFERRKSSWPTRRDRLPRPRVVHLIHDTRPELSYPTEATELTRSLDRIRDWLANANVHDSSQFRPGLTQNQIAELAKKLPYVLTEELCELYRWADGTEGNEFLIYYDLFKSLAGAIEQDYQFMCDLNDREYPGLWKKKWFPVFGADNDWWIQELSREPRKHGPMINYYSAGGEPERHYRSLTEMMLVWAECYERGAFQVDNDGGLQEDRARFAEIHRTLLRRRG